jgi:O-antigen ligase
MPLVLLLVAILPLKQHPIWTGAGGAFSGIKIVGLACVVYALIHLLNRRRWPRYLSTWQARWFLVFALLAFTSSLRASFSFYFLALASLLLLFFILVSVVDSIKRLRWVVLTAVASLGWASLYVLREWQQHQGWATAYRGAWVVGDENHFAISAICAIPLAWFMAQRRGPRWERWFLLGCMLLTFVATLLAASRGGLLGLVAAMLFMVFRSPHRGRNFAIVFVLLGVFNIAYPRSPLQRLIHPNVYDKGSESAHKASWQAGLHMISEHPLAGVGVGAFKSQMEEYAPDWYDGPAFMAHNAYISVGAEMGIPGLLLFLSILIATCVSLERTYRNKSAPLLITRTAVALQAGLIGNSISISFISAELHEHLWFIIVMSACLPPLVKRAQARAARRLHQEVRSGSDPGLTVHSTETA